jgi:hypothetical protein
MYTDYYAAQSGNGVPVFYGGSGQRGHGLGSVLSRLFRSAMPMLKKGLSIFGRHALKTGLEMANDVAGGQTLKHSARQRIPDGIKRFVNSSDFSNQSGSGHRGRGRKRKSTVSKSKSKNRSKSKKRRKNKDIFA